MAVVWEPRGEPCDLRAPRGGLWAPGLSLPPGSCITSGFPSNLPHNQAVMLLCAQAGEKEAFEAGGNRHPKGRTLTNIKVRGNSHLRDKGVVGLRQRAADTYKGKKGGSGDKLLVVLSYWWHLPLLVSQMCRSGSHLGHVKSGKCFLSTMPQTGWESSWYPSGETLPLGQAVT